MAGLQVALAALNDCWTSLPLVWAKVHCRRRLRSKDLAHLGLGEADLALVEEDVEARHEHVAEDAELLCGLAQSNAAVEDLARSVGPWTSARTTLACPRLGSSRVAEMSVGKS